MHGTENLKLMNILLTQQLIPTSNAKSYLIFTVLVSLTSTIINDCPWHEEDTAKKEHIDVVTEPYDCMQ
jgi:hypothetical protein